MQATFTVARPGDAERLVPLLREFYDYDHIPLDEPAARRALAQLLADARLGLVYLIELGGELVGYLVVTFGFSLEFKGRDAFVDELFLRAEFRGRGLGGRALAVAEETCRAEGVRALHLEVERANTGAQGVYRRAGFKDHDRYLLTKWLD
ncbi:MAG: GNAT family N-acetyltransferase [Acidobacteria bacterium]|nr:GNAT family N-acetyltransferase [Acidobacteriota bacterium]